MYNVWLKEKAKDKETKWLKIWDVSGILESEVRYVANSRMEASLFQIQSLNLVDASLLNAFRPGATGRNGTDYLDGCDLKV